MRRVQNSTTRILLLQKVQAKMYISKCRMSHLELNEAYLKNEFTPVPNAHPIRLVSVVA